MDESWSPRINGTDQKRHSVPGWGSERRCGPDRQRLSADCLAAQLAICAREVNPSLARMLST